MVYLVFKRLGEVKFLNLCVSWNYNFLADV